MELTKQMSETFEELADKHTTDGDSFIRRYKRLGFRHATMVIIFGGALLILSVVSAAAAIKYDNSIASLLLWFLCLLLFGTSIWCIRRALSSRREISSFLEELSDVDPGGSDNSRITPSGSESSI